MNVNNIMDYSLNIQYEPTLGCLNNGQVQENMEAAKTDRLSQQERVQHFEQLRLGGGKDSFELTFIVKGDQVIFTLWTLN